MGNNHFVFPWIVFKNNKLFCMKLLSYIIHKVFHIMHIGLGVLDQTNGSRVGAVLWIRHTSMGGVELAGTCQKPSQTNFSRCDNMVI